MLFRYSLTWIDGQKDYGICFGDSAESVGEYLTDGIDIALTQAHVFPCDDGQEIELAASLYMHDRL